jgi:triacylglycerol lipase/cholesterol oxidase
MWGSGNPAAFQHENLSSITHARLDDIFGGTSMNYYRHIRKMVFAGASVPYKKIPEFDLPRNYLEAFLNNQSIPTLLVSGSENHIFPKSNQETYFEIKKAKPEANVEYVEIPAYGHQDVFIGRSCDRDVFPYFIEFLNKHRG